MFSDDLICRAILYPRAFPNAVFDTAVLLKFDSFDDRYVLSVASQYLLGSEIESHRYGCRAASTANKRWAQREGRDPLPIEEARHYLGYYELRCGKVESVSSACYRLQVKWAPEDGEDAHFHIELNEFANSLTNKQKRSERAVVSILLAQCLFGPSRNVCADDEGIREELESIKVQVLEEQSVEAGQEIATAS
jgi:hypothetical protein